MVEAVMIWNELNNPAHWHGTRVGEDPHPEEDPGCVLGLEMIRQAAVAARESFPEVELVFPGLSPMDPAFLERAAEAGALHPFDALAGHNFWFDFGPPSVRGESGLDELERAVERFEETSRRLLGRRLPVILSEIGASSFSGDDLQALVTERTLRVIERLVTRHPRGRATWYSLFDLPEEYMVTSLYRPESHGEVRHRKFGLFRHLDGAFRPKEAARAFARRDHPDRIGVTQWFRMPWPDPERGITPERAHTLSYEALEAAPPLLRSLEVEWLRINVTWCDWHCALAGELANGLEWFDDLISALSEFRLLVTIFQTPPQLAQNPDAYAAGSVPRPEAIPLFGEMVCQFLERYSDASTPRASAPNRAAAATT